MNWLFGSREVFQWGLGLLVNAGCLLGLLLALRSKRRRTALKAAALGLFGVITIGALAWILHDIGLALADQGVAAASPHYRFEIKCHGVYHARAALGLGLFTAALPLITSLGLLFKGGLQQSSGPTDGSAWSEIVAVLAGSTGLALLVVSLVTYLEAGPLLAAMALWMS